MRVLTDFWTWIAGKYGVDQVDPNSGTFEFARNLIAACPTFREQIVDAATEDEAKTRIYKQQTLAEEDDQEQPEREGDPPPEINARPYAVILDDARRTERVGTSTWAVDGSVVVVIEVPVPDVLRVDHESDTPEIKDQKHQELRDWGIALAGALETDYRELSGRHDAEGNPFLNVLDVDLIVPPADPAEDLADAPFIGFAHKLTYR